MGKPTGILDIAPEILDRPLTDDEKVEIEESKENLNWDASAPKEGESLVVIDEEKKAQEEAAETAKDEAEKAEVEKVETERLDAKAKEAGKTVEEIQTIEAEEQKAEDVRIEVLAKEQGKTVDEVKQAEADAKVSETDESKEQVRLETIAKEDGITVEEVKAAEEKDRKVVENYSNDPVKLARALRKENSSYGKLKADHEKLVEFKKEYDSNMAKFNEKKVTGELEAQRDKLVEEYIKLNPDETDEEEGVLFERAKTKIITSLKLSEAKANKELTDKAVEARDALIKELPEEFKEYASDIKEVLASEDDNVVLSEEFKIKNLCFWARGQKFTPEHVKSIIEAAEKRGKEQPEIIEKGNAAVSSSSRSIQNKKHESVSVKDKDRALEMFANKEDWSEDKKISEYMENHKMYDQW